MLPDRVSRLLTAYVDGELDRQQRKVVVRWLRRSAEARELLRGLQKDAAQLSSLPRQSLGQDFAERVLEAIARRQAESARPTVLTIPSRLPKWTGLAAAAAALLALGLGAYYSFRVDRFRQSEPLAVRPAEIGHSRASAEPGEPQAPTPSLAKRTTRELLGPPVPENQASSASSVATLPTEKSQAPAGPRQMPLGSPIRKKALPFEDAEEVLPAVFDFRELLQDKPRQQLQRQLQKKDGHRIDLDCKDTLAGIERLRSAFRTQEVQFILDQDAQAALKLGMGSGSPFAVYCEDLTAHEVASVLEQLCRDNQKRFHRLAVAAMPWDNGKKLSYYLGIDSDQWIALHAPPSESGQVGPGTVDRRAFVAAFTPGRPRPSSAELKRFFDRRKERRADTIRIFLVLSPSQG